ncbi:MAG TPA: two-component sensor histidine kinase [Bacteroidales bacterium]|nr:two-component sensor histidine kinase [Bacteroidales bacterium]
MKIYKTRYLALLIAGAIAGASILEIYLSYIFAYSWLHILVIILLTFLVWFIILFYLLNNYIIARIKPIYKLIHSLRLNSDNLYEHVENKDIIAEVQKEVTDWAENKTLEIAKLKAGEKFRKEFLANVSHELKTPLFSIQGYIYTLLDGGLEDQEIAMPYLEKTKKNVNRLIHMVNDIETISRLEAGEIQPILVPFDFAKLVYDVFEHNEFQTLEKNVKLKFNNLLKQKTKVFADKKMIFDVMTNLVLNGIKYGRIDGTLTVTALNKNDELIQISVMDNGIGIAQEDLPRIFERFYRADKSRSRGQGGTGLGLAIVKHALEAHKQTITVTSEPQIGTTFVFNLKKAN